ncbi:MAG: site-2 protease family protein [Acidobacteriota bacterium]
MPDISLEFLSLGTIWFLVFLFSTTCHEGAHALVAKLGGDPTALEGGQVTLNPFPHIQREPFGMVVVPVVSYFLSGWMMGWASAPYNPYWAQRHPRRAAWMALAGPAANFTLMLLAAGAIRLGMALGYFQAPETARFTQITEASDPQAFGFAATFLSILFMLNLILGTFNLIPFPPLDGNAGITILMSEDKALRFLEFSRTQGFGILGILIAWMAYSRGFGYLFMAALNLLYPGTGYG